MAQLVVRNLENDVKVEGALMLGSRLRERFLGFGLETELMELRGQPARPATFEE